MKVSVLTPPRLGGPFYWARDLVAAVKGSGVGVVAEHIFQMSKLVMSPLYINADIVHTTLPFPVKLWRKPMVLTIKADYTIEPNVSQRFYPKVIAEAQVITTPSHYIKNKLGIEGVIVIPNAVFPDRFRVAKYKEGDKLKLATVMNFYFLGKARGCADLISMLVRKWDSDYRYIIVGGGTHLDIVKAKANGYNLDIRFSGFLYQPEIVLSNSDIFLYYSYHDNFPNAILEAMACGLPVVTNKVGAVSEIIENGKDGYIAESEEEFLDCLGKLVSSVELRRLIGSKARQSVIEKFSWDVLVGRYVEIYKSLAG
jgi:glycosyltransferase involved in cell wall biosynthesis